MQRFLIFCIGVFLKCINARNSCESWWTFTWLLSFFQCSVKQSHYTFHFHATLTIHCCIFTSLCRVTANCKLSILNNEKALRETQTLHAGCSKTETENFLPRRRPLPGGTGQPKFNQLEMVTTFTYKPSWWGSMHAISIYHGNRSTNKQTHRQDRLQYTTPQLACSIINLHSWCKQPPKHNNKYNKF